MAKKVFIYNYEEKRAIRAEDVVSLWMEKGPKEKYGVIARVREGNNFDEVWLRRFMDEEDAVDFLRLKVEEIERMLRGE